jgi:hypothetical protein
MSDNYIDLIPQNPTFVPSKDAVEQSVRIFRGLAHNTGSVTAETSAHVLFRDCGGNFSSGACPECGSSVPLDWWADRMNDDYDGAGFVLSPLALPCGHTVSSLNDLKYEWEQGFSMFVLRAANPNLGFLLPLDVATLEESLGCKLRVIYRHI